MKTSLTTSPLVGRLVAVHLTERRCAIQTRRRGLWQCRFASKLAPVLARHLGQRVEVCITGAQESASGGAARIVALQDVSVPRAKALPAPRAHRSGKQLMDELAAAGLLGIWADRQDIGDSAAYARSLREQAQASRSRG